MERIFHMPSLDTSLEDIYLITLSVTDVKTISIGIGNLQPVLAIPMLKCNDGSFVVQFAEAIPLKWGSGPLLPVSKAHIFQDGKVCPIIGSNTYNTYGKVKWQYIEKVQ